MVFKHLITTIKNLFKLSSLLLLYASNTDNPLQITENNNAKANSSDANSNDANADNSNDTNLDEFERRMTE